MNNNMMATTVYYPGVQATASMMMQQSQSQQQINPLDSKPFWKFNTTEISNWIRQLTPGIPNTGGMLFPSNPSIAKDTTPEEKVAMEDEYRSKLIVGNTLVQNLIRALSAASSCNTPAAAAAVGSNSSDEPMLKKPKIGSNNSGDIYQILDPSFAKTNTTNTNNNSTDLSTGAILSRITLGGLVNALGGVNGGIVDTLTCIPLSELELKQSSNESSKKEERKKFLEVVVPTAGNLKLKDLISLARGLHRSIAAR